MVYFHFGMFGWAELAAFVYFSFDKYSKKFMAVILHCIVDFFNGNPAYYQQLPVMSNNDKFYWYHSSIALKKRQNGNKRAQNLFAPIDALLPPF